MSAQLRLSLSASLGLFQLPQDVWPHTECLLAFAAA
jgi:hypothetical protein